jgi:hypothetical protein
MEPANNDHDGKSGEQPTTSRAHPRIYLILVGLAAWFVLATWSFAGAGLSDYLLVIVDGFIFVAIMLTLILFSVAGNKNNGTTPPNAGEPSLRDWARWDYETWTGRIRGAHAATQILLPIAAAAIGMTAIGIIYMVAERASA